MSDLGDAMTRKIKQRQDGLTPEQRAAQDEARRRAAEEAKKVLDGSNGFKKDQ